MKTLNYYLLAVALLAISSLAYAQNQANQNRPKHNQVAAEFPGHKYAIEIAVKETKEKQGEKEITVPVVFAHLADAHFNPIKADVNEVQLNFLIDRKPKSFVLTPVKPDPKAGDATKQPSVFELKDPELAKLISSGWPGNATVSLKVAKTPYNARLMKAKDIKAHNH